MKYNKTILSVLLSIASFVCLCQENTFSYRRKLNVTQAGWNTIKLPPDIFVHCDDTFNDLRLYSINGADTVEIPYLLKKRVTQVTERELELSAINKSTKNNTLFITFEPKGEKVN